MTSPVLATTDRWGNRSYRWPPAPAEAEFRVAGVTTALRAYPKPALERWKQKNVAYAALDNLDVISLMVSNGAKAPVATREKAMKFILGESNSFTGKKADKGTVAHAAVDHYLTHGKMLTDMQLQERMRQAQIEVSDYRETQGYVTAAISFILTHEPEVIHNEVTVFSREHGYAGTTDMILRMPMYPGGEPVVMIGDFKTSKAIYAEPGLQLVAYSRADFIGMPDGTEVPLPGRPIQHGVIVQLKPDGTFENHFFGLSDQLFNVFLGCLAVSTGDDIVKNAKRPG